MNIARLLYPVEVLGPGKRLGIWTCGCPHHCPGCSNPELWEPDPDREIKLPDLKALVERVCRANAINGFTITGGDPFFQAEELAELLSMLSEYSPDIIVYTGFTLEELQGMRSAAVDACLERAGVLIDGPYIEARNTGVFLRGSDNQRIIILNPELEAKYTEYLKTNTVNRIQNFQSSEGIISVGIHRPDFQEELERQTSTRGVILDGT